jgi:hypothetical protein
MQQDALRELTALCAQLRDAERDLSELDDAWKKKSATVRGLTEEDIPALMAELGVKKLTLESGETITVKADVECSLPKEDLEKRAAALKWLEDNGHGGLIKTIVATQFGRGELEKATALAEVIATTTGKEAIVGRDVHASTLKSFLNERIAAGDDVPLELFNARPLNKAKIK